MILNEIDKALIIKVANILQELEYKVTGENTCAKHYDPMQIIDEVKVGNLDDEFKVVSQVMLSYAFNLKDGGRQHPVSDYNSVQEIIDCMVNEVAQRLKEEINAN